MSFRSVNEIEKFSFDDCEIVKIEETGNGLEFLLEALIVLPDNSQNSNYTKSYAGTAKLIARGAAVLDAVVEGFKEYDANDVLLRDVGDEAMSPEETHLLFKTAENAGLFLFRFEKGQEGEYRFWIERTAEDDPQGIESTIYRIRIRAEEISVSWDRYQNRVSD